MYPKHMDTDEARLSSVHVVCLSNKCNKESSRCFDRNMTTTIQTSRTHLRLSERERERERERMEGGKERERKRERERENQNRSLLSHGELIV